MSSEQRIKEAFGKVKEDVEGVKNELAFTLKRIAKIEELLTKQVVLGMVNASRKSSKKKR